MCCHCDRSVRYVYTRSLAVMELSRGTARERSRKKISRRNHKSHKSSITADPGNTSSELERRDANKTPQDPRTTKSLHTYVPTPQCQARMNRRSTRTPRSSNIKISPSRKDKRKNPVALDSRGQRQRLQAEKATADRVASEKEHNSSPTAHRAPNYETSTSIRLGNNTASPTESSIYTFTVRRISLSICRRAQCTLEDVRQMAENKGC